MRAQPIHILQKNTDTTRRLPPHAGKEYTQYSLHNVHLQYQWVMALAENPRLLEAIKAVVGPDVLLLDSRFICKYPISGGGPATDQAEGTAPDAQLPYVAWHQDMRYTTLYMQQGSGFHHGWMVVG